MAKNRSKKNGLGQKPPDALRAPSLPPFEWDSVDVDFFAREADLYRVSPVESFEDLDRGERRPRTVLLGLRLR